MPDAPLDLTEPELREGLTACLAVPRWVDQVAGRAPYASVAELVEVAGDAAVTLSPDEIDQALSHHPRIGEAPTGAGRSEDFARSEQAASASEDEDLAAQLARGNRSYEETFGRVFLIRAAGRSRREILSELHRRLRLDPVAELGEVAHELREIALLRIPQLFGHLDRHSSFDESDAAR